MTKKARRTPEQLAAEYQRKANAARAKAAKLAREKETRELLELGRQAKERGLGGESSEVKALTAIGRALAHGASTGELFVKNTDGTKEAGLAYVLWRVNELLQPGDRELITAWWRSKNYREV